MSPYLNQPLRELEDVMPIVPIPEATMTREIDKLRTQRNDLRIALQALVDRQAGLKLSQPARQDAVRNWAAEVQTARAAIAKAT